MYNVTAVNVTGDCIANIGGGNYSYLQAGATVKVDVLNGIGEVVIS